MRPRFPPSTRHESRIGGFRLVDSRYPPDSVFAKHSHEHMLVYQIRHGTMEELVGRKTLHCEEGTVVVMPGGVEHTDHYGARGASNFVMEVTPETMKLVASEVPIPEPAHFTSGSAPALLRHVRLEASMNDSASPLAIEALMIEVLVSAQIRTRRQIDRPAWLSHVLGRLHDAPAEPVTLTELGIAAGVHPVHLAATFRRRVGCTIGWYVRRLRLGNALCQLRSTDDSIADIAIAAGFADQSHFCRVFRALTGFAPSTHRRRLKRRNDA